MIANTENGRNYRANAECLQYARHYPYLMNEKPECQEH